MYTYVSAKTLAYEPGSDWVTTDLSTQVMSDLFSQFKKAYVTLAQGTSQSILNLASLKNTHLTSPLTLNQVLVNNGSASLPTSPTADFSTPKSIRYSDSQQAGYVVNCAKIGLPINDVLPLADRVDAYLTRPTYPDHDPDLLYRHALVTVNGYLHKTEFDGTRVFLKDAGRSLQASRFNTCGILSFLDIGEIELVPITAADVHAIDGSTPLADRALLTLSGSRDLTNKTVLLSVGGYLHAVDGTTLSPFNGDTWIFALPELTYLRRYYESQAFISLEALGLPVLVDNPSVAMISDLRGDTVYKKYLTLSQSFFIVVNTPRLEMFKYYLKHHSYPNYYTSYFEPRLPLLVGHGRMVDYWKVHEERAYNTGDCWGITVTDNYRRNPTFGTSSIPDLTVVNGALLPSNPHLNSTGFLLEMVSNPNSF